MKKHLGLLGLILLLGTGIVLVCLESQAIDLPCDQAEFWCVVDCWGDFSLDYCWESGPHTYCYFYCTYPDYCSHWSANPVYSICTLN